MNATLRSGNEVVCAALEQLGVEHVFGLPGTQNVALFDALRRSSLRTIVPTHELAASFMAGAYARISGRPGVLVTIPGPGFTYAITGLAEARLDSAPVVHLVGAPAQGPGRAFNLQAIDQRRIVEPLVKRVIEVGSVEQVAAAVAEAYALALADEPGPVVVQLAAEALSGNVPFERHATQPRSPGLADPEAVARVAARLRDARRVALFAGQGAREAAEEVRRLAERIGALVATTPSGRGTLPEDHALALGYDSARGGVEGLNALMAEADCVLILGAKLGHNGTAGFALAFPPDRTVHVDTDARVLGANYGVAQAVHGSIRAFLTSLLAQDLGPSTGRGWEGDATDHWRSRVRGGGPSSTEPRVGGTESGTAAALFAVLRSALPRDAILVTDTGRHQGLARRYYDVLSPGGLLMPSDLQSMGFGMPAAIAAGLAAPGRPVVAVIGDGGFLMSGLELATAVRESVAITVVVFSDGAYGQIRDHQLLEFGRPHGVSVGNVPVEGVARALGCDFFPFESMPMERWLQPRGVTVVEVAVGDSVGMQTQRAAAIARGAGRRVLGPAIVQRVKQWLHRPSGNR